MKNKGPLIWNKIPLDKKRLKSYESFRKHIRWHIISPNQKYFPLHSLRLFFYEERMLLCFFPFLEPEFCEINVIIIIPTTAIIPTTLFLTFLIPTTLLIISTTLFMT